MSNATTIEAGGWAPVGEIARIAEEIGRDVAAKFADEVDREARFPAEAVAALREHRLLSAMVPVELGGGGASLWDVACGVRALAHHCTSTALVFAMHQIQVAMLVDHGLNDTLREYLRELCEHQLLIANGASEVGIGGESRTSACAVEPLAGGRFRLDKMATTISYGAYADSVLVTARANPAAGPSDQVILLAKAPGLTLEQTTGWDTMGLRGTCSTGFHVVMEGDESLIFPVPYSDVAEKTGQACANILLGSAWLGLAESAASVAHRHVRLAARGQVSDSVSPDAMRLAQLATVLQTERELVEGVCRRYERVRGTEDAGGMAFAVALNNLKVSASSIGLDIVRRSIAISGVAGYLEDGEGGLGRQLRDAYGAVLMVNNDRVLRNNAQLLLVLKDL